MGYIQSFRRYETKYLLTEEQKSLFLREAGTHLKQDRYGEYKIFNLYLDTEDFYFIEHSLDKPVYKEKLRIRSYGAGGEDPAVFLEIKKKYRHIVYKRRITIPLSEAEEYIRSGRKPDSLSDYIDNQIFSEIDFLMKKYCPTPKLFLAYERTAYSDRRFGNFRVTFDKNIRGSWDNLTISDDGDNEYLDTGIENYCLMEIKCGEAMPVPYSDTLSKLKLYPVAFSKYGRMYTERFQRNESDFLSKTVNDLSPVW